MLKIVLCSEAEFNGCPSKGQGLSVCRRKEALTKIEPANKQARNRTN